MREHGPSEFGGTQTLTDVTKAIGETHGVRTIKVLADLTVMEDVERTVRSAESDLGPIDILVHNAGGDITRRPAASRTQTTSSTSSPRMYAPSSTAIWSARYSSVSRWRGA